MFFVAKLSSKRGNIVLLLQSVKPCVFLTFPVGVVGRRKVVFPAAAAAGIFSLMNYAVECRISCNLKEKVGERKH